MTLLEDKERIELTILEKDLKKNNILEKDLKKNNILEKDLKKNNILEKDLKKNNILEKDLKKKCKKLKSNNFVRNWCDYCSNLPFIKNFNLIKFAIGNFYLTIHSCLVGIILFLTLFNTSLIHLIILLIIVSLDAISVVVLHGCPLTHLEKKYLGITGMDFHNIMLKNMKIFCECNHIYEQQIELLINVWCIITFKILMVILLNQFNIKLINFNCLYSS